MRRKILPGKNPLCVCGHRLVQHYQSDDAINSGKYRGCKVRDQKLLDKFNSVYCACPKFLDRRHCKIKDNDPVLHVLRRRKRAYHLREAVWYDYPELTRFSGVSRPTVSRKCNMFLLLGLVDRHWGYGFIRDAMEFRINWLILEHLRKEGIIVD